MTWLLWDERLARRAVPLLVAMGASPNLVTTASLLFGLLAIVAVGHDLWLAAAVLCIARWLDHVDGALARATNRVTRLGAYYDNLTGAVTWVGFFGALSFQPDLGWVAGAAAAAAVVSRTIEVALSKDKVGMIYDSASSSAGALGNLAIDEAGFLPYWTFPLALALGSDGIALWLAAGTVTTFAYVAWLTRFSLKRGS